MDERNRSNRGKKYIDNIRKHTRLDKRKDKFEEFNIQ